MFFLLKRSYRAFHFFLFLGVIAFALYQVKGVEILSLMLIGPSIYLAYFIKKLLITYLGFGPVLQTLPADTLNNFFFLMPVTIAYFGLIGFQITQLQKEHGWIRHISVIALVVFIGFIHYKTWGNLTAYLSVTP